jgi:hypothetical protein
VTNDSPYHAAWRVLWWDWRNHHDWVGRRLLKGAQVRPLPPRRTQDFLSREGAEKFIAKLRRQVPEGDLVVQLVSLRQLLPPPPRDALLPGPRPLQRPAMKGD